ncbi:MAG: FGGY family carbohydrate kinase [Pirellulaceae bacterium]|nr:FGGY family carbohydrate kinase [Pirellulaceae bacterium]
MVNKQKKYLIGIDIGTQGTKAALFDKQGRTRATAFRKSRLHRPEVGVVEEDPDQQFQAVCHCLRTCVNESGIDPVNIAALGIDGQMAGVIGVGDDGNHVTPYDSWLDTRCGPQILEMQQTAGKRIIQKTGGPPSFNHGPKILWWKDQRSTIYQQIRSFVQPGGYAAMRLCGLTGEQAFIDKSYLHFSGFADNRRAKWDAALCQTFDIEMGKLPRIVDSNKIVGEVTAQMARRSGLKPGTAVIAGCGDTAASFLACGATKPGICVDVAGTASVFAATTKQFKSDTKYGVLGWGQSATPGLWHPYAYINGGGMNLEWFAKELASMGKKKTDKTLEQLGRMAARITPQLDDPIFVPHLGGRNSPAEPNLRGAWAGLTWSHSAAHMFRAALEGVALEYYIYLHVLRSLNPELKLREIRVTGGGEKSAVWNTIKSDALGVNVIQVSRPEGAPTGAALLAGYGIGLFPRLADTAQQWIKTGALTRPNRQLAKHYTQRAQRYQRLNRLLNEWSETQ